MAHQRQCHHYRWAAGQKHMALYALYAQMAYYRYYDHIIDIMAWHIIDNDI